MKNWLLRLVMAVALVVGHLSPAYAQVSDVVKSGSIDLLDEAVTLVNIAGRPGVACVIGGTFSATLTPEISVNDSVWEVTQFYDISAKARVATTTASGSFVILGTAGMTAARVKATTYSSGTVTVTIRAGAGPLSLPADVMSSAPAGTENGLVVRSIAGTGTSATQVQGTAASGSAAVGNPVQIGGIQTNGNMQTVKVDGNGYLNAILGASSSVIGAVTQGASGSYVNSWGVQGAALEGTALTTAPVAAGLKDTAGAIRALKGSTNGDLFVTLQASSSVIGAVTQSGTWTATAPSTGSIGTAAAFPMGARDPNDSVIIPKADSAGSLFVALQASSSVIGAVTQGASGSYVNSWGVQGAALEGTALTTAPVAAGLKDTAGAIRAFKGSTNGDLFVTLQASTSAIGTVTQGASASYANAWPIQGTALEGSAAVSAPVLTGLQDTAGNTQTMRGDTNGNLFVTLQASTSAIGTVAQGASSSVPWATNLSDPSGTNRATITSANALKVDGSAVTQPISGSVSVTQVSSASVPFSVTLTNPSGAQLNSLPVQASGSFPVTGTFWQATQPISGSVSQASSASVPFSVTLTNPSGTQLNAVTVQGSGSFTVAGTATVTQGASSSVPWATNLSDPSGVNRVTVTAANALKTDGSAVTQPISGTVTANAGTGTFTVAGTATVTQGASSSVPWLVTPVSPDGGAYVENWKTPVSASVSIANTATQFSSSTANGVVGMIIHAKDVAFEIGGSGVTFGTGLPLAVGEKMTVQCQPCNLWYGITSSGTADARVVLVTD